MKRLPIVLGALAVAGVAWLFVTEDKIDGGDSTRLTTIAAAVVRESFKLPLARFRDDVGRFPTTEEGMVALSRCPAGCEKIWKGPYIEGPRGYLEDPWRNQYQYRSPGTHNPETYDIWSLGPDGGASDDDIGNWKR